MENYPTPPLTFDLVYWITERYAIKLRREQGLPAPWSADPIMQSVRFCNVHREDDKVTKWIRQNWNRANDPVWKFVLGRMINLPESLWQISVGWEQHPDEHKLERAKLDLKIERELGKKIWTSAYTISTCGLKMDKIDYVFSVVNAVKDMEESPLWRNAFTDGSKWTLKLMCEFLMKVDGLGSFLAAQVVADMKNTPGHPLQAATDWWTWSAPGPGSLRGLGWWKFGTPAGVSPPFYESVLGVCRREVDPLIPDYIPRISNQDFQNCLCEFSKYAKVKYLGGHVRNKYNGTS